MALIIYWLLKCSPVLRRILNCSALSQVFESTCPRKTKLHPWHFTCSGWFIISEMAMANSHLSRLSGLLSVVLKHFACTDQHWASEDWLISPLTFGIVIEAFLQICGINNCNVNSWLLTLSSICASQESLTAAHSVRLFEPIGPGKTMLTQGHCICSG